MTPELFLRIAVVPALSLLPERMDSAAARVMLVAIALQESKLQHRHQVGGPAHGFLQFESGGGVAGVLHHRASSLWISLACQELGYPSTEAACYPAIEHNDILACLFARLLLWTLPDAMPGRDEPGRAWQMYLDGWRPGKPHEATWAGCYAQAWQVVAP